MGSESDQGIIMKLLVQLREVVMNGRWSENRIKANSNCREIGKIEKGV